MWAYPEVQPPHIGSLLWLGCKPRRRSAPVAMFQMQSEEMYGQDGGLDQAARLQEFTVIG